MHALGFTKQTKPRLNSTVSIWIHRQQSFSFSRSFSVRLYFSHTFGTQLLHSIWACCRHWGIRGDCQVWYAAPSSLQLGDLSDRQWWRNTGRGRDTTQVSADPLWRVMNSVLWLKLVPSSGKEVSTNSTPPVNL